MKKILISVLKTLVAYSVFSSNVFGQLVDRSADSIYQMKLFYETKLEFEKYEQTHGATIETNNVKMHYLTWGNPKNTAFVWLHGTYGNCYELTEIVDSLVKMNLYVIGIDYYGHGFTPIPKKEVSLYHVADDIKFLLDSLHIKQAIVGGWSRGGSIATAFYDAYPSYVMGLILDDGGSVAWSVNDHKKAIDTVIKETRNSYKDRKPQRLFNSEFEAYYPLYRNYLLGKTETGIRRETFTFLAGLKRDSVGKWRMNPGVGDLTCMRTADQLLAAKYTYLQAPNLFGASTEILYPKIIYRNLQIPLLIFDPVSENDWFDFEEENRKLQLNHPAFITHKVYANTDHNTKGQNPGQYIQDISSFVKTVFTFHGLK